MTSNLALQDVSFVGNTNLCCVHPKSQQSFDDTLKLNMETQLEDRKRYWDGALSWKILREGSE